MKELQGNRAVNTRKRTMLRNARTRSHCKKSRVLASKEVECDSMLSSRLIIDHPTPKTAMQANARSPKWRETVVGQTKLIAEERKLGPINLSMFEYPM